MKTYIRICGITALLTIAQCSIAQDLIVSQRDDTLNCKITDVDQEYIYFTFKNDNDVQKTLMKRSDAKVFRYGFFDEAVLSQEEIPKHYKYRLSGTGGFGWLTAETKSNGLPSNYVEELKSGYSVDGDAAFYLSEEYALGAKFMSFYTSNALDNIRLTYPDGSTRFGNMKDNISVYFIGPSLYNISSISSDGKITLASSVSIGYVSYNNDGELIDPIQISGGTAGFAASIGIDILSSGNIGFGVELSVLSASISEYEATYMGRSQTVTPPEKDNISRVDLTFGLKFYK